MTIRRELFAVSGKGWRRTAAGTGALLLALATGACGSGTSAGAAQANSGQGAAGLAYAKSQVAKYSQPVSTIDAPPAIADPPEVTGKTVWYIPFGNKGDVLPGIGAAMSSALANVGVQTHVCDGNFVPTTVGQCMEEAATQGAAAVVTSYVDYSLIPTAFENLVSHHVPVLVGGEAPTDARSSDSSLAFLDLSAGSRLLGQLAADEATADSDGKAEVLLVRFADSSSTLQTSSASENEFKQRCPGCTVHAIDGQTAHLDKLASAVSAALVANPGTRYVIAPSDGWVPQVASGINSAGFGNKAKIIGSLAYVAGLQRINQGQSEVFDSGLSVSYQGWEFADGALRLMAGAKVPAGGTGILRVFTKSSVQGLTLTPASFRSGVWYGGADWQKEYLTAWGTTAK